MCWPREIIPGVWWHTPEAWNNFPCCTNPQRWGHMCQCSAVPKTPNSCNGCRSWNGPSCVFLVAQYLFTGLSFLSHPGPNSRLLGPHISSFRICQNFLAFSGGKSGFPGIPWDSLEMCWSREIIPGVCDILQRPVVISFAAQTPKGGAICVSVQQFLRHPIAVMVAVFFGCAIPFHRLVLSFSSRPKL